MATGGEQTVGLGTYSVQAFGSSNTNLKAVFSSKKSLNKQEELGPLNQMAQESNGREPIVVEAPITRLLMLTSFLVVIGGSFPHGYNTGVINTPSQFIKDFINESYNASTGYDLDKPQMDNWWGWTVAIYLLGGMFGSFAAGYLADKLGRKKAVLSIHIYGFVAAAMFFICRLVTSHWLLIIGRFVVGFGSGAGFCLVPLYLIEIGSVNIRGAMGVLHQLGLTSGILVSMIVGMDMLLGTATAWHILLTLTCLPNLLSLLFLPFMPESPRYLLHHGKEHESIRSLQRLRNREDVTDDLQEIKHELLHDDSWTLRQLLAAKELRLPLVIVAGLGLCQQLSGINFVFYYSTSVFESAGIESQYSQYVNIAIGFVNVMMTVLSALVMEKFGRRFLLLGGMALMVLSMIVITISLKLKEIQAFAYLSCVFTVIYVVGFAVGLGPIPQFIAAELFKQGPRSTAMAIGGVLNWTGNFIVALLFPTIQTALGPFSFLIFIAMVLLFGALIFFKMPETKGKSQDEIEAELRRLAHLPQKDDDSSSIELHDATNFLPPK